MLNKDYQYHPLTTTSFTIDRQTHCVNNQPQPKTSKSTFSNTLKQQFDSTGHFLLVLPILFNNQPGWLLQNDQTQWLFW
jgi:hypothetical protein